MVEQSTRLAVTVTKEPMGNGRFRIVADMRCGNPFGCTPEAFPALMHFNRTVSAAHDYTALGVGNPSSPDFVGPPDVPNNTARKP